MIARTLIISESEVSITVLCLLCSPRYTAVWIKNCSKSTSAITVATMKNMMVPRTPVIIWNWSIHCHSLSAMFDSLHSNMNQEVFEKHLGNKSSHYEKYGRFLVMRKGSHHVQPPNKCFSLSSKMNGKQRRTLVSPWRMHCTCCMPKGTSRAEATSNSERIKPAALPVIELR